MARPRVGAFFDVDKTILAENSGTLYLRLLYDRGEVDWRVLLRNLGAYFRYKLNVLDLERWTEQMVQEFAQRREEDLVQEAREWFVEYVQPTIYAEAEKCVQHHLEQEHVVALVSGGTKFVLQPLADYLGVQHIMGTHMEVEGGVFTGRVVQPICFGEGKIYWLQQLIEHQGLDLAKSYFYTDSITDLPLLDLVGHPVVVNPDPLLYREARRRRWPVHLYQEPRS